VHPLTAPFATKTAIVDEKSARIAVTETANDRNIDPATSPKRRRHNHTDEGAAPPTADRAFFTSDASAPNMTAPSAHSVTTNRRGGRALRSASIHAVRPDPVRVSSSGVAKRPQGPLLRGHRCHGKLRADSCSVERHCLTPPRKPRPSASGKVGHRREKSKCLKATTTRA
jgi:hypothetical protein